MAKPSPYCSVPRPDSGLGDVLKPLHYATKHYKTNQKSTRQDANPGSILIIRLIRSINHPPAHSLVQVCTPTRSAVFAQGGQYFAQGGNVQFLWLRWLVGWLCAAVSYYYYYYSYYYYYDYDDYYCDYYYYHCYYYNDCYYYYYY